MYYKKMVGQKIGQWTVVSVDQANQSPKTKMICKCDCGTIASVDVYSLHHNLTQSCGHCKRIIREGKYMRCIMKNDTSFIFDPEDEDIVKQHSWSIARGHIRTVINGKTIYLHRLIMNCPDGVEVDHINMDKSDNRRCNLRIASHAENQRNRSAHKNNTSGYKGVCLEKRTGKYFAYINSNGCRYYLGRFANKELAAQAYNQAAIELHGDFARLNNV